MGSKTLVQLHMPGSLFTSFAPSSRCGFSWVSPSSVLIHMLLRYFYFFTLHVPCADYPVDRTAGRPIGNSRVSKLHLTASSR